MKPHMKHLDPVQSRFDLLDQLITGEETEKARWILEHLQRKRLEPSQETT